MKKIFSLLLVLTIVLSLCACGNVDNAVTQVEEKATTQTENLTLEQIVVDDSYRDKDNSPRRAVYAFFTLNPKSKNIDFDSKIDITINEANTYTSEVLPGSMCKYAPNYYYGGYIETAYVGEEKKFVATFLIPEGDLASGKQITFADSGIEEINKIKISTDEIIHVNGDEEACKKADPEGYAEMQKKYEEASPELTAQVQSLINDRYWEAYVNPSWYRVEFTAPNNFSVETTFGTNGGTYSVRNGYIFCTYDSNGETIEIPYEIEEQGVTMDLAETFRIN